MSTKEYTPKKVFELAPNEIFVFETAPNGHHDGGAAAAALKNYGAVYGQASGLQGQSYAIPAFGLDVDSVRPYVDEFVKFAAEHPQLKFLVTYIGGDNFGRVDPPMAPLFKDCLEMDNVVLPKPFVDVLLGRETDRARYNRLAKVFEDTEKMIDESYELSVRSDRSKAGTVLYDRDVSPDVNRDLGKQLKVTVTKNRTFQGARELLARNPGKWVGVLNFASATSPGGGVLGGSSAQEESLCRCSTLYHSLTQDWLWEKYYSYNQARNDRREWDSCLYTDACIYTPGVVVIKSDENQPERLPREEWFDVDVITCAAPNFRCVKPLTDEQLRELHIKRGRKILDVALANKIDCLVLGAFGCGAFRNDPKIVASAYAELMKEYSKSFDEIEFAIFCVGDESANYDAFNEALME